MGSFDGGNKEKDETKAVDVPAPVPTPEHPATGGTGLGLDLAAILHLQGTIGNRAVTGLLKTGSGAPDPDSRTVVAPVVNQASAATRRQGPDLRWKQDEKAARYRGQVAANRIRSDGMLSKENRAKINSELAYFEGVAKDVYLAEVTPALKATVEIDMGVGPAPQTGQQPQTAGNQFSQLPVRDQAADDLKVEISASFKSGDAELRAAAQKSVYAGGGTKELMETLRSSHRFNSAQERLRYERYFLQEYAAFWGDPQLSDSQLTARMLEIEQPWRQRVATEEREKAEGMAKAEEQARAAAEEKALREALQKLKREETQQRFPGHTDPRAYYGLHSASSMLFANPIVVAIVDMAVYLVPVGGEVRMVVEAIRGRNLITGDKLGTLDRILGALPALPLLTKGGKIALKGARIAVSSIGERASLIFGIARRAGRDPLLVLALAEKLEKVSGSIGALREARNALQEGRTLTASQQGALDELNHALEEFNKTSGSEVSAGKAQHTPDFSEAERARLKVPAEHAAGGSVADIPSVPEPDPRLVRADENLATAQGTAEAARARVQAASAKAAEAEQAAALADQEVAQAREEAKLARAERARAKKAYDGAKPGSKAAPRAEYTQAKNAAEKAESKVASAAKRAKSAKQARGEAIKAVPRQEAVVGRAEQVVAQAEEQRLIELEADRLRKLPKNVEGLRPSWDYERFPKGPRRDWRPGDPINMPDAKGTYPGWATNRKRIWITRAIDEQAARAAGTHVRMPIPQRPPGPVDPHAFVEVPKGGLPWLDPIREATDEQLAAIASSGSLPGPLGAEIEHARIPQRAGEMLEEVGVDPNTARRVTKLGDPDNLMPTRKEIHAIVDEAARILNPNRNPTLKFSLDVRTTAPFREATDKEIADIVKAIKDRPQIDLGKTKAGRKLRRYLAAEKKHRPSSTWQVP